MLTKKPCDHHSFRARSVISAIYAIRSKLDRSWDYKQNPWNQRIHALNLSDKITKLDDLLQQRKREREAFGHSIHKCMAYSGYMYEYVCVRIYGVRIRAFAYIYSVRIHAVKVGYGDAEISRFSLFLFLFRFRFL
jgi:hypothetical protein